MQRGVRVAGAANLTNVRAYPNATDSGTIVLGTKAAPNRITLRSL